MSIEVGSGHSTRVLAKALGGVGEILAIDPAPRADIAGLPGVQVVPSTVQAAPAELFDGLGPGDVLFIDSSHILMPGSDVDLLLNRVLPRLPSGVLVHIHDIFLPFDYPPIWGWRAYNEQQGVLPLLTTGAYVPVFSSVWAQQRLADRLARSVVARLPPPSEALLDQPLAGETLMLARIRAWLFDGDGPKSCRSACRRRSANSRNAARSSSDGPSWCWSACSPSPTRRTTMPGRRGPGRLLVRDRRVHRLWRLFNRAPAPRLSPSASANGSCMCR